VRAARTPPSTLRHRCFPPASRHPIVAALDRVERPRADDEKPKRILTADELARLVAAVPDRYRLIFEFAAQTGARLGEALGVTWGTSTRGRPRSPSRTS
jgi:integrase